MLILQSRKFDCAIKNFTEVIIQLNKKVDKYNMIVPILNKQRVHYSAEKEIQRVRECIANDPRAVEGASEPDHSTPNSQYVSGSQSSGFVGLFRMLFK